MNWYYTIAGGHTHVRVFMNGAKCGDLCFRNEEFLHVRKDLEGPVVFIDQTELVKEILAPNDL